MNVGGGEVCREEKGVNGELGSGAVCVNDFLAVQRDVKDRLMRDGAERKLMSYTFHTAAMEERGGGEERCYGKYVKILSVLCLLGMYSVALEGWIGVCGLLLMI